MKKLIVKGLFCALVLSAFWSCSTENDVQMSGSGSVNQKEGSLLRGIIAEEVSNGQYQIIVDQEQLRAEVESIAIADGAASEINSVGVVKKELVNAQGEYIPVLVGGGFNSDGDVVTFAFSLVKVGSGISLENGDDGDLPPRISCTGCATGCFLEYYKLDETHFLGYCDSAGCGDYCFKNKLKKS